MKNMEQGETATQEQTAGETQSQEKKYTDDDLDRIIGKRLAREREKIAKTQKEQESDLDKRERKLNKREMKADAIDILSEKGLPRSLADLLDYESKESCEASISKVEGIIEELHDLWEIDRSTGRVPKKYGGSENVNVIERAFRPQE